VLDEQWAAVARRYERLLRKLLVLPNRPAVILLQAFRGFVENGRCAAHRWATLLLESNMKIEAETLAAHSTGSVPPESTGSVPEMVDAVEEWVALVYCMRPRKLTKSIIKYEEL